MAFSLLKFDRQLCNAVRLKLGQEVVYFQFPPIVKADSKGVDYEERNCANIEPMATFKGSKARQIDLKWTYIVTGDKWTAREVAANVKAIRSFYYQTVEQWARGSAKLNIEFQAYDVVGRPNSGMFSFRSDGVTISHSDAVIGNNGGYYPLRTDIDMKLKLWSGGEFVDAGGGKKMVTNPWLKDAKQITPQWR